MCLSHSVIVEIWIMMVLSVFSLFRPCLTFFLPEVIVTWQKYKSILQDKINQTNLWHENKAKCCCCAEYDEYWYYCETGILLLVQYSLEIRYLWIISYDKDCYWQWCPRPEHTWWSRCTGTSRCTCCHSEQGSEHAGFPRPRKPQITEKILSTFCWAR